MTNTELLAIDSLTRAPTVSCVLISKNEHALRVTLDAIDRKSVV